jgi:RNA polymerase sigma factor (sigma-70 family)
VLTNFLFGFILRRVFTCEVQMTDSQALLADYVRTGSEPAFRELVDRYLDLVYSAAVRLVGGDSHLAQDIAQTVFIDLARTAPSLPQETLLGGWLHRHTCYVAANTLRGERRRRAREQHALAMNAPENHSEANLAQLAPLLDEAVNQLGPEDRAAILLRFFEQRDLRSVGEALGSSEDAARMRVSRALEKLHTFLVHRGVTLSAVALGTSLGAGVVTAAPAGLAATISTTALAATAGAGTTLTLLKLITMTKLQVGIVGAVAIAGVTTSLVLYQQSQAKQRAAEASLQQQADQLANLRDENQRLKNLATREAEARPSDRDDLLRLRAETEALRQQTNNLAALVSDNRRLRGRNPTQASQPQTPFEFQEETAARVNFLKAWGLAFHLYASKHGDAFPTNTEQVASFLTSGMTHPNVNADQFELVYRGSFKVLTNASSTVLFREKVPRQTPDGKWVRIYGITDGSVVTLGSTNGDFAAKEREYNFVFQ